MKTLKSLLFALLILASGCTNKKAEVITTLHAYTPMDRMHEALNGHVKTVTHKVYLAVPEGNTIVKGRLLTNQEIDSLSLTGHFMVTWDEAGDAIQSLYLDENGNVFQKWEVEKENNIRTIARYTFMDTIRFYNRLTCDSEKKITGGSQYRYGNDTLVYSYKVLKSADLDTTIIQRFNYKGEPTNKTIYQEDSRGQRVSLSDYDSQGNYTGGRQVFINDRNVFYKIVTYDKDRNVIRTYLADDITYDDHGNWISRAIKDKSIIVERTYTYFE